MKSIFFFGNCNFRNSIEFCSVQFSDESTSNSSVLSANNNIALQKVEIHQNDIQAELCIFLPSLEQWGPLRYPNCRWKGHFKQRGGID